MPLNRRELISGTAAAAGGIAIRRFASAPSVFAAASPAELAADPRRPRYHLLPPANWMNDPNGPIFRNGQYHMFYQYNPNGAYWGDMHWGHAVSPDMVHWRHLPVALAPTPGGPDAGGCFSGSALADGDQVAVLYTGVVWAPESEATSRNGVHSLRESQCLAIGTGKDLTTWTKVPAPVIAAPPAGLDVTGFRDPAPWRHGDAWYLEVGSGIRGQGGAVLLYRSTDLHHWEYLHLLAYGSVAGQAASDPVAAGDMWECPDFFPLGRKHVLIHSTQGKAFWQSGEFDPVALVFHAERGGILDYGAYYAPKSQLDGSGNRILWGWILETRPEAEYRAAGWAGVMSLPRLLTLDENGDLQIEPARQVESLRGKHQRLRLSGSDDADRRSLARMLVEDGCGEILCSFYRGADPLELALVAPQAGGPPWLTCRYDPSRPGEILIDGQPIALGGDANRPAELRIYLDGSVIECFVNRRGAVTRRFYAPGASAPAIAVRIAGSLVNLADLSMWELSPI